MGFSRDGGWLSDCGDVLPAAPHRRKTQSADRIDSCVAGENEVNPNIGFLHCREPVRRLFPAFP